MSKKDEGEVNTVEDKIIIQDAFIFCPKGGTFVLNEVLKQGIFASEQEMRQMEDTKNSIFNKFVTIDFEEEDAKFNGCGKQC